MSENKPIPEVNKEHERFKIQIYADRTHTIITIGASLAFAFLSLISIFYILFYEGVFGLDMSKAVTGWEGIFAIFGLVMVTIAIFVRQYNKNSAKISDMIEFIEEDKDNALPPLCELNNWNAKVETKNKPISQKETGKPYNIMSYFREIVIGVAIAVVIQGSYDAMNIADTSTNFWWVPMINSLKVVGMIVIGSAIIWLIWGRKKRIQ
jgi:hypothetical protein